jgi:Mrp family chromosome partitioning ATPase
MSILWALASCCAALARESAAMRVSSFVLALATPLIGLGCLAGLGALCGGMVLGVRVLGARAISSPRTVKAALGWPVLARISPLRGSLAGPALMASDDNIGAYGRLQRALGSESPLECILVTSAAPSWAAATVAGDLAYLTSVQGMRTLLIDAQLAGPSQAERFGVPAGPGLTDAARTVATEGRLDLDVTQFMFAAVTIDAPLLRVIPAGSPPPDVRAALGSRSLGDALASMKASRADVVIVDAPPFTAESSAAALAADADGVLVVVELGRTCRRDVMRLRKVLLDAHARVLGCIMVEPRARRNSTTATANRGLRAPLRAAYAEARE